MTIKQIIAIAAIVINSIVPMTMKAATIEIDGVTWTYSVNNSEKKTVTLGGGSAESLAMAANTKLDAANIPWTFVLDGETYTVTAIAAYAFNECGGLTGTLTIPDAVTSIGSFAFKATKLTKIASLGGITNLPEQAFQDNSTLEGSDYPDLSRIVVLGKNVFKNCKMGGEVRLDSLSGYSSSGENAFVYSTITNIVFPRSEFSFNGSWMFGRNSVLKGVFLPGTDSVGGSLIRRTATFAYCSSLKVFLAGPRTGIHTRYGGESTDMFEGVSNCRIFVPAGDLALGGYYHTWDDLDNYVSGQTIIHYGPGRDLDLAFNHDTKLITAMPATAHTFTNFLAVASTIKEVFGYDIKINLTNAIDVVAGSVNAQELSGVTCNPLTFLTFGVKTQAQLDSILAAVPITTPIVIDPEGATENLKVSTKDDRKVYVMLPKNGTYKIYGFSIIVK